MKKTTQETVDHLLELKKEGVSEKEILALLKEIHGEAYVRFSACDNPWIDSPQYQIL